MILLLLQQLLPSVSTQHSFITDVPWTQEALLPQECLCNLQIAFILSSSFLEKVTLKLEIPHFIYACVYK